MAWPKPELGSTRFSLICSCSHFSRSSMTGRLYSWWNASLSGGGIPAVAASFL
jgi:hypothetical protein